MSAASSTIRIASVGHAVFALTIIACGIIGLIKGDFEPIWQPVPQRVPGREILVYLCPLISVVSGSGLLWQRTAPSAARVLLAYVLLWMLLSKVPVILLAPMVEVSYQSCGETAVIVAGAWILYAWFAAAWDRKHLGFAVGDHGVRIARTLYALALIAFGLSHFAYLQDTAPLVPSWLPWHVFWAYFTGAAYLAAAAALLSGRYARLAAALSVLQIGLFTLLVWPPLLMAGASEFRWGEFFVSWAITAGAWMVADSYRGAPWCALSGPHLQGIGRP